VGRIIKGKVVTIHLAGKRGTFLIDVATHCNDRFNILIKEFIQMFRPVIGNINSNFSQDLNCKWMDITGGFGACTSYHEIFPEFFREKALGKVGTTGITCA
jgi:hypothetical protein